VRPGTVSPLLRVLLTAGLVLVPLSAPGAEADVTTTGEPRIALIVDDARLESHLYEPLRRRFRDLRVRSSLAEAQARAAGAVALAVEVSTTRQSGEVCPYGQCMPVCEFTATARVFQLPDHLLFSKVGEGRGQDCGNALEDAAASLVHALGVSLEAFLANEGRQERDFLWVELPDKWPGEVLSGLRDDLGRIPGVVAVDPDSDDHLIKLEVYLEPRAIAQSINRLERFRVNRIAGRRVTLGGLQPPPSAAAEETGSKSVEPVEPPFRIASAVIEGQPRLPFSEGRKWALVIGISSFEDDSISGLEFPARDADAFAKVLVDDEIGRFPASDVVVLKDSYATTRRIKMELDYLARQTRPEDLFLFFISTHAVPGAFDAAGDAYLVTHDTERSGLYATGFPMRELVEALTYRIQARTVVGILDACHTGQIVERTREAFVEAAAGPAQAVNQISWGQEWTELSAKSLAGEAAGELLPSDDQPKRIVLLSSSDGYQPSWESETLGHGFFTYFLIEALRQSHGGLTLQSLYEVLRQEVPRAVLAARGRLQEPQMFFTEDADFPIGYRPQSP